MNQQDAVEQRILLAAQAEFAKHGFHKTVVSDIARRAQVGKGTVYRRFGNKETLFNSLTKWAMQQLEDQIDLACRQAQSSSQALQAILRIYFSFFNHSREIVEIVMLEGMQISGLSREELAADVFRIKEKFRALFQKGLDNGEFQELDTDRLAYLFQSFIWSTLKSAILYNIQDPGREFEPLILHVFLHGITQNYNSGTEQGA